MRPPEGLGVLPAHVQLRGGRGAAAGVVVPHGQALDELGGQDPLWVDWRPHWTAATQHPDTSSSVTHR